MIVPGLDQLPILPCAADDKSPLTTHGFYDARVGPHYSRWPLVGAQDRRSLRH